MSSSSRRHRRDHVREVLDRSRSTGDRVAPWRDLAQRTGAESPRSADALLLDLHREWLRLLVGRLHRGGIVPSRTPAAVRDLYDEVAAAHPTLRALLDTHAANPVLWEPTAGEHAMLARVAGLAPSGAGTEAAADAGRALLTQRIPVQRSALG